jgi:hypothetical protein
MLEKWPWTSLLPSRPPKRVAHYVVAVVVAIAGTLLSVAAFVAVANWQDRLAELKLLELAKSNQQTLNSELEYATEVL